MSQGPELKEDYCKPKLPYVLEKRLEKVDQQ